MNWPDAAVILGIIVTLGGIVAKALFFSSKKKGVNGASGERPIEFWQKEFRAAVAEILDRHEEFERIHQHGVEETFARQERKLDELLSRRRAE